MACDYDVLPSYFELFEGIHNFSFNTYRLQYVSELSSNHYFNLSLYDVYMVLAMAAVFTLMRIFLSKILFKPMAIHYGLTQENKKKMPESAWKFAYYLCAWSFTFYVVVLSGKYCFFQKPSSVWKDWNLAEELPEDIYLIYIFQSGFYVHSLYATLFLDIWRKDSIVMMVHHVVTLALIGFSYSLRYQNIGGVVLFLHDMCDIQLEFMKLNVHFKVQHGEYIRRHEVFATVSCISFAITWFFSRLYWYPLKVLYASTSIVSRDNLILPCALLMNILLWMLQAMNIYWFLIIVKFLFRVATGQIQDIDDTREYDVEEKFAELSRKLEHLSIPSFDSDSCKSNGEASEGNGTNGGISKATKCISEKRI